MDNREFERDEQLLETRRLKRLEERRHRKVQQRIMLGLLLVILVLSFVLIVRGCNAHKKSGQTQNMWKDASQDNVSQASVPTEPDTTVTIAAVGDIMMYDEQLDAASQPDGTYDFTSSFAAVSGSTVSADLTVGNLELNFCGKPYTGKPDFRSPESLAKTLSSIGFDILQTANTYSIQNGLAGLRSTIQYLDAAGISHVGTYAAPDDKTSLGGVLLKNVNGVKIAFIAYTKGLNYLTLPDGEEYAVDVLYTDYASDFNKIDESGILDSVNSAKALRPDVIIAMLHWGSESDSAVTGSQEKIKKLLFENGVDAIIGSHSHIVGPMQEEHVTTVDGVEKNCFVAYSLGNFFSAMDDSYAKNCRESVVLNLSFTKNGQTGAASLSAISYTPLYIMDHGEGEKPRYEILPIRSAINSGLFPEMEQTFTDAIAQLRSATASDYDSGK